MAPEPPTRSVSRDLAANPGGARLVSSELSRLRRPDQPQGRWTFSVPSLGPACERRPQDETTPARPEIFGRGAAGDAPSGRIPLGGIPLSSPSACEIRRATLRKRDAGQFDGRLSGRGAGVATVPYFPSPLSRAPQRQLERCSFAVSRFEPPQAESSTSNLPLTRGRR